VPTKKQKKTRESKKKSAEKEMDSADKTLRKNGQAETFVSYDYSPPLIDKSIPTGFPDEDNQALQEFFVDQEEMEVVGSMSLDLYRDQLAARISSKGIQEYLSFALADEVFAVNILNIKEIIKTLEITQVPRTEEVILGVLSLRGTIVPVIDLRKRLGLVAETPGRKARVLIVQIGGELVGLLVDAVMQVIYLRDDDIEPTPGVLDRAESEHILGVGRQEGEMFTLLDLESVIQIDQYIK